MGKPHKEKNKRATEKAKPAPKSKAKEKAIKETRQQGPPPLAAKGEKPDTSDVAKAKLPAASAHPSATLVTNVHDNPVDQTVIDLVSHDKGAPSGGLGPNDKGAPSGGVASGVATKRSFSDSSVDTELGKKHSRERQSSTSSDDTDNTQMDTENPSENEDDDDLQSEAGSANEGSNEGNVDINPIPPRANDLVLYIASAGVNFSLVSPFNLSQILHTAIEGNPKSVDTTRNGKIKLTCGDRAQYNLVKALKKLDKYNVTVETPLVRAPLQYCLIFGMSPEVSCDDLKVQLDCTPEVVFRLKRSGAPTTTVKLGYKDKIPAIVRVGFMSFRTKD